MLIDFVVHEARLLDAKRYEEWNALFTDDAIYWLPLVPDQVDGFTHTSHLYEDKLLRDLRVERLKSPRAFSQQPPSRSHHLLQTPTVETFDEASHTYVLRTQFHYTEAQGDELQFLVGTFFHHLTIHDGALRMTGKRVDLLNCDAALPPCSCSSDAVRMSIEEPMTDVATVHARFVATARRTPDASFLFIEPVTAQTYDIAAGPVTWRAAADEVARLRDRYAAAGYGHGHRVGLLLENRPAFLFHWFALNAVGASVVPINADLRAAELAYLIGHSEIDLVVTLPERAADLSAAGAAAGRTLATAGPQDETLPRTRTTAPRDGEVVGLDSECALLYTSGTTGRPKGCILGNDYFLRAGTWYAGLGDLCEVRRDAERVITPLPLNHVNAMAFSTMVVLVAGGCLVQLDRFHQKTWWQSVRESRATIVHYLGVMPAMLLAAPASDEDRDHDVRWAFGAGVDRQNHARFEERFGLPLVEAWAMTETGAAAVIMANHEPRHVGSSCFGREEDFVEVRLVDDEGNAVDDGVQGELLVRSAGSDPRRHFFSGYLKDEEATQAAWSSGWFHTGDVVRRDADGTLHFVDRRKNVIRRSGENISAVEVESVLNQHPVVRSAAVAATPDSLRGDEVLACIVVDGVVAADQRPFIAESIVRHALAHLAYFKAPGFVAFVDEVPLTTSQKIQRGQLRELARTLPGQSHCYDLRALKKRQA